MANTRAIRTFWETELSELRKSTSELTQFLALLTPTGHSCAFMSIKGELSWSYFFSIFGNSADDPELDNFVSYVVPLIHEAMTTGKHLPAKEVVKGWVDEMLSQTHFIATSYWNAIHMRYDDGENPLMFKRSAVCPATFEECFPRIHACKMQLILSDSGYHYTPYCYSACCCTPQTPSFMQTPSFSMTPRTLQTEIAEQQQEIIRQTQIRALLEGGNEGGVGGVVV